jgi:MFS family permease
MQKTPPRLLFTLLVLLGINTMNFYDRQVPGAVGEPLRKALGLNDQSYGWINTAFVLLYAAVGVPLGRWADLGRRTRLLLAGVLIWSLFTALSGIAWGFWSMFFLRLGVGVGEASCAPTSNSLLGDLYPPERRARAISIFMLGLPVGLGISSVISGNIADLDPEWGWRASFWVAGVPGLLLGLLAMWIPEPARGAAEQHAVGNLQREGSPMLTVLRIPTLWWIIASGALHNFNMYAIGAFLSPYMQRYHGLTTGRAGWISGLVYCCGGLAITLGGWACDKVVRRRISGRMEVSTVAMLIATPCIYMALRQPPREVFAFTAWLLPGCALLYVYYAGVYSTIQDIVEPSLRGTAMAMYFFAMYLLGAAQGPVVTGWISDQVASQKASGGEAISIEWARAVGLQQALFLVPLLGSILILVLFAGSRTVKRDYENLHKWMAAGAKGDASSA